MNIITEYIGNFIADDIDSFIEKMQKIKLQYGNLQVFMQCSDDDTTLEDMQDYVSGHIAKYENEKGTICDCIIIR